LFTAPTVEIASKAAVPAKLVLGAFVVIALGISITALLNAATGASTFPARLDHALRENRIVSPSGNCVIDIYRAEKAASPQSPQLAEAAAKIRQALEPKGRDAISQRYRLSPDEVRIDWAQYEQTYAFLQELFPSDSEIGSVYHFAKGMRESDNGDNDAALADFKEALDHRANWVLALNAIGNLYMRKSTWPRADESTALTYYQKACQADPGFTWSFKNLGNYYYRKKDWATAETYFLAARKNYPAYPKTLAELGDCCFQTGRYQDAITYFQEAQKNFVERNQHSEAARMNEAIAKCRQALN
jgi:tetratricopeptide (TPR) repeat protein